MKTSLPLNLRSVPENPGEVLDFLYRIGSNFHVITLANLMWDEEVKMNFVRDENLLRLWDNEIAAIRHGNEHDLADLRKNIVGLDILSPNFLPVFERRTAGPGIFLLKKIERLQESIYSDWKSQLPENAFFPALELLFREGEMNRFLDILKSLQRQLNRPVREIYANLKKALNAPPHDVSTHQISEQYRKQYKLEAAQAIEAVASISNFIISFYERKWSLLLSSERGREIWI